MVPNDVLLNEINIQGHFLPEKVLTYALLFILVKSSVCRAVWVFAPDGFYELGKVTTFHCASISTLLYKTEGLFGELEKENAYEELSEAHGT